MNAIFERRSIRKYKDTPIGKETIQKLLAAGMAAPSAGNGQPWHFIVIDDRNTLVKITEFHQYSQMLKEAPAAIIVCGNTRHERYGGFWVQDCAAATQNILLEAHDQGLGSVWLGVFPVESHVKNLQALLEIPEDVVPLSIISLGYPDEHKDPVDRYSEDKVHWNKW